VDTRLFAILLAILVEIRSTSQALNHLDTIKVCFASDGAHVGQVVVAPTPRRARRRFLKGTIDLGIYQALSSRSGGVVIGADAN
jgi:hypothetical protein